MNKEIKELREKYQEAKANHAKLDSTLAKVAAKKDTLEGNMAKLLFDVKDYEKASRAAEKRCLRDEISKAELDEIAKKQETSVKKMHDAERALSVAKQVIEELNTEIRTAIERMHIAEKRLSAGIRAKLICEIPDTVVDKLLEIYGTFPEANWQGVLSETFPAPHPEKLKEARSEFVKGLK